MQKDVIYIDVEDDITAIIGKVKDAEHRIVALVPPKRIGAIQSAVNLKLVHRAAELAGKRMVIISNNPALTALAGSTGIPVAKNLQSKPEIATIPALEIDEGEDIIDGAELPVGDHIRAANGSANDALAPALGASAITQTGSGNAITTPIANAVASAKGKVKVPNFDSFRKKLFLGGGIATALIIFLVWAIVFAPQAKIIVSARTTDAALNSRVTLGDALTSDLKAGTLKSATKTIKKDVSLPVTATGKKEVGETAVGTVKFSTVLITSLGTIPTGTTITSTSGKTYVTDQSVTLNASNGPTGVTTSVTATQRGLSYNGASGPVSGAPSGVNASFVGSTSGGTDKTVSVITQSDLDKVSGDINKSADGDNAKKELISQFGTSYIVLENTYKSDAAGVKPTPALDAEAPDAKGVLAGTVVYTLTAIPKNETAQYLDAYFAQQIDGKPNQKVYSNGIKDVSFTNVSATGDTITANLSTNGKIGPKIDEAALKDFAKNKRFGEIQSYIQRIDGVDEVDVKFSPFWVTKAPNDSKKIQVEFKVNGA